MRPSVAVPCVLTLLYPIWLAVFLRLPERRKTAGVLPLVLPPLLLMGAAGWIAHAQAAQLTARSGLHRAGDAGVLIAFGCIVSATCAAIALLAVSRTKYDAIAPLPRPPIVITAICFAMTAACIAMTPIAQRTNSTFTIWNVSLTGSFLSMALLIPVAVIAAAGQRRVVGRRAQLMALGVAVVVGGAMGVVGVV